VPTAGFLGPHLPDFGELFPVCTCRRPNCEDCGSWQLTPRTAAALWLAAQLTADDAYDDVAEYGDVGVLAAEGWALFDLYPPITYSQGADWRRHAARAYDDLAADLAAGHSPRPRCPAEEMALHLILERVREWAADSDTGLGFRPEDVAALPARVDDMDWRTALDVLFVDHDILLLFDPEQDGIEDPGSAENQHARMGDYRPAAWFAPFGGADPRDPRRGFRR
jgi:hypothetical protein